MKVAIITDTHAGARNDNASFNDFFLSFYEEQFIPHLKENNIKHVLHLGDVFDRRKYINFNTLRSWQERVFQPLNDLLVAMDILVGNHDTYFKNTNTVNSVDGLLSSYDKFKIHSEPTEVTIDGRDILFLPWICDDNVDKTLQMIEDSKSQICMGHLELIGFEMLAGHVNQDKGLKASIFDKFHTTLTGHFHHRSSLGGISYLGSPYPIIWSDWGATRGFHVFDTETLELVFVENTKQIFCKIVYDDSQETFESLMTNDYSELSGRFVKIVVQNKTNPYWFDQFLEAIQKVNPADISIVEAAFEGAPDDEVLDETKDTISILTDHVKSLSLQAHETELLSLFNELYIEALNTSDSVQGS